MEAQQLVGRELSEADFALRSRGVGDDLDKKINRSTLDLQHLREEVSRWQEKLARVRAIMQKYQLQTQGAVQQLLVGLLAEPPEEEDVAEMMTMSGGLSTAREILTGINAAGNLLASHLEQREKLLGTEMLNLKGRVRTARQEIRRYQDITQSAERLLKQDAHLDYESEQRARLEISAYTRRQRELGQLESSLVDPQTYVPQSEESHLRHLVLSALAGGK